VPPVPPAPSRPSPFERDRAKKAAPPAQPSQPSEPKSPERNEAAARERLHTVLSERGLSHLADAVENSEVTETATELKFVTRKSYELYLKDVELAGVVKEVFGRPLRIVVTAGEVAAPTPISAKPPASEDEVTSRALANPEVRRFREVFGGEVRKVRNLKE
jgi:hypothetical protein